MIGQIISHYQIKRELGRGGMGVVYLAEDLRLGRQVAIKALPAELSRDPLRRKRFEQEARACAVLNHSSIAAVFDLEEVGDELFIVFEYVDGEDLRALLRRGALGTQQLLKFAGSIARGLATAHQVGIIHRDLKPENIRVNTLGETKILDFGLARMQPELLNAAATFSFALTQQGNIVGTVGYMSPEQLESRELDARSDIFSLGVVLYEMAAGVHPFQGESPASTIANVLTKDPAPVEHLNPVQPPALDLIIRKCLAKKKEQRYQSVGELLLELEDIQRKSDDAMKTVVIAPATATLPAMDPDSVLAKSFARLMPNVRGWWEMHHIFMAVIILGMFPTLAWQMRGSLGGQLDLFFFFVVVIFAMIHFVFRAGMVLTVLFNRARQAETIQNLGPVVRLTHILLCLSVLFAAPKFVVDHPLLGTVFAGIVVGGILVSLAIEPWMERTAFPQLAELREELLRKDEASSTRGARKWWLVHHLSAMLGWSPMVAVLPWLVREWLSQQNNVSDFIVFLCILFAVQNFGFRAYVLEVAWFHREALEATVAKMATPILLCNLALVALCATISTFLFKAHSLQAAGFMVMAVGTAMIVGLLEPNFNRYAFPRRDDDIKSTGKKLEMDDITRLGLMQLVYLFPAIYLVVNAAPELLSGGATWSSRLKDVGPTVSWTIGVLIMLALVAVVFLAATGWGLLVQRRADIVVTFRKYFLMFVLLDIGGMACSITISAGDRYILPALALIAAMFYGIRYQWILVNRIAPPPCEGRFKWDHSTSLTAVQLPYIASHLYLLGDMLHMMDKVPMWISQPKPSDDLYGFFVFTVMSTAGALILGSLAWALLQRRPDVVRTFKRWFILFVFMDITAMQGGMLALARNTNLFILLLGATAMLYGIRYQWILTKSILAADAREQSVRAG